MTPTPEKETERGRDYLGIGLYSIPEAARLLKADVQTMRRWVKGYTYVSNQVRRKTDPMVLPDYPELAAENVVTFIDLIELHVVRMLRKHEVPMKTIREAARRLTEKTGTRHPFALKGIDTDARRIFHTTDEGTVEELGAYQYVMDSIVQPFFKQLEYDEATRLAFQMWPLGPQRVVLDPRRGFGKPIVYRGGVPTLPLYKMRLGGESVERIARWYEISPEAVRDAIAYEESLAA